MVLLEGTKVELTQFNHKGDKGSRRKKSKKSPSCAFVVTIFREKDETRAGYESY